MAAEHELTAIGAQAPRRRSAMSRALERVRLGAQRHTILAYRRLFLADKGNGPGLSEDGALVLAAMAREARLGMALRTDASEAELREANGARRVVLKIINRLDLDGAELDRISRQLREIDNE